MLLDASAVLALLNREPGWEAVQDWVPGAPISAVNLAEVIGKLCDAGLPYADACAAVEFLRVVGGGIRCRHGQGIGPIARRYRR